MFIDVKERINLSKYVSKSTDEMIKKGINHDVNTVRGTALLEC